MIVVECLQALVGSLGILLTLPFTSLICAVLFHGDGKGTDSEEAEEYSRAEALLDIAEDEMKSKLGEENEE